MPRIWRLIYEGDRIAEVLGVIDSARNDQRTDAPYVMTARGATWRVFDVHEGQQCEVALEPVDAHDPPPTMGLRELPMAHRAI
jgi:hypothetical protein